MMRNGVLLLLLSFLLLACQREAGRENLSTLVPVTPDGTAFGESQGGGLEEGMTPSPTVGGEIALENTPLPLPEAPATDPTTTARFSNLRFAVGSQAPVQANFPIGTEEICAIWDYHDMAAT
ncbi:MAG: hypothetical protein ACRDIB_00515, partial [Ardenticatenaceae bacterium]